MVIAFYINEINFRGLTNSIFKYAYYNQKILKNKSVIFYNLNNYRNQKIVINNFKKKFKTIAISSFSEIDNFKEKLNIEYIYVQKGGEKDEWYSSKIKTLVHVMYPQKLCEIHGHRYVYISEWLSNTFSNKKIEFVPLIVENYNTNKNLRKNLQIENNHTVFGYHGGSDCVDLEFAKDAIIETVRQNRNIFFLFLNIDKFVKHERIIFIKGTSDNLFKRKFINTCDAMIYSRKLGECFGLSCAEFSIVNKKIILYKHSKFKNHLYSLHKDMYYQYSSYQSLMKILASFDKEKKVSYKNKINKYKNCNPIAVMKKFEKIFFKKKSTPRITLIDYVKNYIGYTFMLLSYLRHKFYVHYYNYFYSKIIKKKKF